MVVNGTVSKGLNMFSKIRRIGEQGLENLFITSSSSNFFNKTELQDRSIMNGTFK